MTKLTLASLTENEFNALARIYRNCLDGMGGNCLEHLLDDEYTWGACQTAPQDLERYGWSRNEAGGTFSALIQKGLVSEYDDGEWVLEIRRAAEAEDFALLEAAQLALVEKPEPPKPPKAPKPKAPKAEPKPKAAPKGGPKAPKAKYTTREEYLHAAIKAIRPEFERQGSPLPKVIRAGMCPPHSAKQSAIGFAWHAGNSKNEREIWISATISDELQILGVLVHELCHIALPVGTGHGPKFKALGTKMLLTGVPTCMGSGSPEFAAFWKPLRAALGAFPAGSFPRGTTMAKPQPSAKHKNVNCPVCGFHAKVLVDQMDLGRLRCPVHGEVLETKEERAAAL